jgi:tRNA A37 threonylcarbamoyladenosine synthetase subunit TsaC/SUA5/YrdC
LILNKKKKAIYNGDKRLSKIGIRIPRNKAMLSLLNYIKKPLATTSANLHKEKNERSITKLKIIMNKDLKTAVFSSEKMTFKESTLVATSNNEVRILRKGQLNKSLIRKVIKSHGYSHKIK